MGSVDPLPVEVGFSPDSSRVVSIDNDHNVRLWDITSKTSLALKHINPVDTFGFSPNGRQIVTISGSVAGNGAQLWNTTSGELLSQKNFDNAVQFTFADGYARLISLRYPSQVIVQDLQTTFISSYLDIDEIKSENATASSNGKLFAAFYKNGLIKVWDIETGRLLHSFVSQLSGDFVSLQFNPDGTLLAVNSPLVNQIQLWSITSGQRLFTWNSYAVSLLFSPDSQLLLGSGEVWSTTTGLLRFSIPYTIDAAFSPNSALLALGDIDYSDSRISGARRGSVRVVNTQTGNVITTLHTQNAGVIGVAFSPDGWTLAAVCLDNIVQLWTIKWSVF